MQGCHGSCTPRAQTLPAFSESSLSGRRGALGARLDVLVCEPEGSDSVAVLSSMPDVVRNSHGLAGMESTFAAAGTPMGAACISFYLHKMIRLFFDPKSVDVARECQMIRALIR